MVHICVRVAPSCDGTYSINMEYVPSLGGGGEMDVKNVCHNVADTEFPTNIHQLPLNATQTFPPMQLNPDVYLSSAVNNYNLQHL